MFSDHKSESLQLLTVHYNGMKKLLFASGRKFTNDIQLIEDCIHDVLLKLCEKEDVIKIRNLNSYLLRAFRNSLTRELSKKMTEVNICEIPNDDLLENSVEDDWIDSEETKSIRVTIAKTIDCLSRRQREIILLCYMEQRSYDEICQLLGLKYQVVRNIMNSALKRMRVNMAQCK